MTKIETLQNIDDTQVGFSIELNILFEALSDWDDPLDYVEEYLERVKEYLGGTLNLSRSQVLDILGTKNVVYEAWKMESVSTLLKLLDDSIFNKSRLLNVTDEL